MTFFLMVELNGISKCVASAPTNIFSDGMLVDCRPSLSVPDGANLVAGITVRCNSKPKVNRNAQILSA